ncbi:MAG: DUF6455 family protein [Bacteroidota bacterium]|jgi:hypothetical protein
MDSLVSTNEMVGFLAGTAILAMLAALMAYSWRVAAAAMAAQGAPRFHDVVRRLGIDLGRVNDERTLRAAAVSVRRCLTCRHQDACDAWLADPAHKGVPPDCPNESFLREQSQH